MGYGTADAAVPTDVGLFAPAALLITFRETLEAAIIISVLLGILHKTGHLELRKYVWMGVISASLMCIALGIIVLVLVSVLKDELFSGETLELVEGVISIIAALLIAMVAITIGNVMAMHEKFEKKFAEHIEGQKGDDDDEEEDSITKESILFLSFTSVAREGIETIIFFTGIGAAYPPESLPIPGIVGAVAGALCGVALYRFGSKLTIVWFFRFTMGLLVLIGAGVWTNGWHYIQEYGTFGTWQPEEARSGLNKSVWDIRDCCDYDESEFWIMMRVLFGYTPNPSSLEILLYISYILIVMVGMYVKQHKKEWKARFEAWMRGEDSARVELSSNVSGMA